MTDILQTGQFSNPLGRSSGTASGPGTHATVRFRKPEKRSVSAREDLPSFNPQQLEPGECLFGFRLRKELGRGAFARVFLAEQADLAGRLVVLKISGIDSDEPQTLAQLQHTHIVPIYSMHENQQRSVRAVCMPYFGGAPLSSVLQKLWQSNPKPAEGVELVEALRLMSSSRPTEEGIGTGTDSDPAAPVTPSSTPAIAGRPVPLTEMEDVGYIQAVAWVVVRLADAVQHAHDRGVLHRDIKPSNVLLGDDGQPMLLDFNVAQLVTAGAHRSAVGGTVAYMAPEHLQALANPGPESAARVDERADIYSLGMVLYEMLTGARPFEQSANYSPIMPAVVAMALERGRTMPSLRSKRPDAPWSLESIVRKCLQPDSSKRYQRAEHLGEDLRRFIDNRPLKYAPELSFIEQTTKLMRRHPRLTSSGSIGIAAAMLVILLGMFLSVHLNRTRDALKTFQVQERKKEFSESTVRALCLVNTVTELQDNLRQGLAVCEQALALYGVLENPDWQDQAEWQGIDPEERGRLAEDARELLMLVAWARVQLAPKDRAEIERSLELLDRAEAVAELKPSRALWEDRARLRKELGDLEGAQEALVRAEQLPPTSARDHYLLATSFVRKGKFAEAIEQLNDALRLNPRDFWSMLQLGLCHWQLKQNDLAAGDFGACIGLWPESPWGYFNRGCVFEKLGKLDEAMRDYRAAISCDPNFFPAVMNRGLVYLQRQEWKLALDEFHHADGLSPNTAAINAGLGVAFEGLGQHEQADAAFAAAFAESAKIDPSQAERIRWVYGFAVSTRLPEKALEAFESVLREHPDHIESLYGCAMIHAAHHQEQTAIGLFNRVLAKNANFVEARRYRATLQARVGKFPEALQDINWCMEHNPGDGASLYAAACIAARASERANSEEDRSATNAEAVRFLELAFANGYGRDRAAKDPDLTALHNSKPFNELLSSSTSAPGSRKR